MDQGIPSWLRETLKLFIQYLGVGFSSIPSGLVFFILTGLNVNQNAALVVALCIGFTSAYFVWNFLDKRTLLRYKPKVISPPVVADIKWKPQPLNISLSGSATIVIVGITAMSPSQFQSVMFPASEACVITATNNTLVKIT